MLTGCHACEPLDTVLKIWRQRFLAQGCIHGPKPLTKAILIRAVEPWFVISKRAGQQLHRTPGGLISERSHGDPPICRSQSLAQAIRLQPMTERFHKGEASGCVNTVGNCGAPGAEMRREWGKRTRHDGASGMSDHRSIATDRPGSVASLVEFALAFATSVTRRLAGSGLCITVSFGCCETSSFGKPRPV